MASMHSSPLFISVALSTVIFLVVILVVVLMNLVSLKTAKRQEVNAYDSREKD